MQRTVWISKTNTDRPWWGPLLSIINVLHYSLLSPRALLKVGPGADSSSRVCMMQRTVWISKTNTDRPWWGPLLSIINVLHYSLLSPRALLKVGPGADSSSRVCMMQRTVWISKTNTDRPWWGTTERILKTSAPRTLFRRDSWLSLPDDLADDLHLLWRMEALNFCHNNRRIFCLWKCGNHLKSTPTLWCQFHWTHLHAWEKKKTR